MRNRTKSIILLIAVAQLGLIIGLLALPTVVQAIPGRYRVWLQENHPRLGGVAEGVIEQVAPVATALPAPCLRLIVPSISSRLRASRTVVRLTPSASANSVSGGMRPPGNSPLTIMSLTWVLTWSVREGARRSMVSVSSVQ